MRLVRTVALSCALVLGVACGMGAPGNRGDLASPSPSVRTVSPRPSPVASTLQIVQAGSLRRFAHSAVLGANGYVWFTSNAHSIYEWSAMGTGGEHPLPAGGADPAS